MKRRTEVITAKIERLAFPCAGVAHIGGDMVKIKDALPGQVVSASVKRKGGKKAARFLEVLENAPYETEEPCPHFGLCNGCRYQRMTYEAQLELKERAALSLFEEKGIKASVYRGITPSPEVYAYRNKMEFSFGDTGLGGELSLGMRKKNSFYEVVHVTQCRLIDEGMSIVLKETLDYFKASGARYYNTRRAEGALRHLVVRKSSATGEMLINLVTTSAIEPSHVEGFKNALLSAGGANSLKIAGILHTVNDSPADTVKLDNLRTLYGRDYISESVLGLSFKITPQSFFQTNTRGAELLYKTALELAGNAKTAYDLYCGTGTISLLLASRSQNVYGIEIVPEAVEAAREAAAENGVSNAEFICGDVLAELGALSERQFPDLVVLDPPRGGVHPKALKTVAGIGAEKIVYISCNPLTLVNDLLALAESGYALAELALVDMFPWTPHVECVASLCR